MYMYAPGQIYFETVDGQTVNVADIPNLRFQITKSAVDPQGNLKTLELSEPVYDPPSELSDDVPLVDLYRSRPLPVFPPNLTEATGGWLISTSELALDLWCQVSRANMTHLCPKPPPAGGSKPVKPLYRVELGLALRYKVQADREVWTRTYDKKTGLVGEWGRSKVEKGKLLSRMQGVRWGDRHTLMDLVEKTSCVPLPPGESRDTWFVERMGVIRTFVLPYSPSFGPTTKPQESFAIV